MDKLEQELIADTTIEDIAERYRPVVEIVGIEKYIEVSRYAMGDEVYFPKPETLLVPARNRRIRKEYDGFNTKELAQRYNLTLPQIHAILKDEPIPGQMNLMEFLELT